MTRRLVVTDKQVSDFGPESLALLFARRGNAVPGMCYACGCMDHLPCDPPCSWVYVDQSLCDNPTCVKLDKFLTGLTVSTS